MGFISLKLEDQRRDAAEKVAASRRATEAQQQAQAGSSAFCHQRICKADIAPVDVSEACREGGILR